LLEIPAANGRVMLFASKRLPPQLVEEIFEEDDVVLRLLCWSSLTCGAYR